MERANSVIQYLGSILQAKDQKLSTRLATLTALAETLENYGEEDTLKKSALCLHEALLNILRKPCQFWGKSAETIAESVTKNQPAGKKGLSPAQSEESHFIHHDENCTFHPLLYTQAMRCLYSIFTLHESHTRMYIDKTFLHSIMGFLSINSSLPSSTSLNFYQFGPEFSSTLTELINGCGGEVKVFHHQEADREEMRELLVNLSVYQPEYCLEIFQGMKIKLWFSSLKVTSQDSEISVAEELISQHMAWKPSQRCPESEQKVEGDESKRNKKQKKNNGEMQVEEIWTNARVTCVLQGNFVWIQVGEDKISLADKIKLLLKTHVSKLVKVSQPKRMAYVAVQILVDGSWEVIRARVMSATIRIVTVFDIDTGHLHRVSPFFVCKLPFDLSETQIPPLVTLVRLHGVLPIPLDVKTVEIAAATLNHICRYNRAAADSVMESGLLTELPDLIVCPDADVASQCLRLAANFIMKKRLRCTSVWLNMLVAALDMLNICVQRSVDSKFALENSASSSQTSTPKNKSPKSPVSDIQSPQRGNFCRRKKEASEDLCEGSKPSLATSPSRQVVDDKTLTGNLKTLPKPSSPCLPKTPHLRARTETEMRHKRLNQLDQEDGSKIPHELRLQNYSDRNVDNTAENSQDKCSWKTPKKQTVSSPESVEGVEGHVSNSRNKFLILSCLLFLINRLYMSKEAKNLFYHLKGLELVMRAYLLHFAYRHIRISAVQVLCNFVHVTQCRKNENLSMARRKQEIARHEAEAAALSASLSSSSSSSSSSSLSLSRSASMLSSLSTHDQPTAHKLPKHLATLAKKEKVFMGIGYEEGSDSDGSSVDGDSIDEDFLTYSLQDLAEEMTSGNEGAEESEDPICPATGCYIKGSFVPFRADARHELYQTTALSAESVATIICGMLNSGHEGKIYLGIDESGEISGQRLGHSTRDELRLGIDQIMMQKLTPSVFHSQFHVKFIPVAESIAMENGQRKFVPCQGLYVVEIACKPVPRVLYCLNSGRCYYRMGAKTIPLGPKDIRHMIVIEEEEWHKDQIFKLQSQLAELKKAGLRSKLA